LGRRSKRERIHPPYYLVLAYMKIRGIELPEIATNLNMGKRTFLDKVYGFSDFTISESSYLKQRLGADDNLFLTSNVTKTSQT